MSDGSAALRRASPAAGVARTAPPGEDWAALYIDVFRGSHRQDGMLEAVEDDGGAAQHERDAARWLAVVEELLPDLMSSRPAAALERLEGAYARLHEAL